LTNSWGKTAFIVNLLGNIIWGPQSEWFRIPLISRWPYPRHLRIISTAQNLEDRGAFAQEVKKWWPPGRYESFRQGRQYDSLYKADNGFIIDCLTFDMDDEQFESTIIGLAIFDEIPPESKYKATVARLKKGGLIIFSLCPLEGSGWIDSEISDRADGKKIKVFYGDISANCREHGIRGVLEHENIMRMIDLWDPMEVEARAHGKPLHLIGRVYNSFDYDVHTVDGLLEDKRNYTWYFFLDPHDRRPPAAIWLGVDTTDDWWVVDEWPSQPFHKIKNTDLTIKQIADIIKAKESDMGISPSMRFMDPNWFNKVYPNSRLTVSEEYRQHGIKFTGIESFGDFPKGVFESTARKLLRERMFFDKNKPLSSTNHPKLYILRHCHNVIYGFRHYLWDEYSGRISDKRDVSERPQKRNKCFPNLLEYACMAGIRWRDPYFNPKEKQFHFTRRNAWQANQL